MLLLVNCNFKLSEPKTLLQNDEPCTSQESNAALEELMSIDVYDSNCSFESE